jgi:hypothetical protein
MLAPKSICGKNRELRSRGRVDENRQPRGLAYSRQGRDAPQRAQDAIPLNEPVKCLRQSPRERRNREERRHRHGGRNPSGNAERTRCHCDSGCHDAHGNRGHGESFDRYPVSHWLAGLRYPSPPDPPGSAFLWVIVAILRVRVRHSSPGCITEVSESLSVLKNN